MIFRDYLCYLWLFTQESLLVQLGHQDLYPGWPHSRQVFYPLCYHFGPCLNIFWCLYLESFILFRVLFTCLEILAIWFIFIWFIIISPNGKLDFSSVVVTKSSILFANILSETNIDSLKYEKKAQNTCSTLCENCILPKQAKVADGSAIALWMNEMPEGENHVSLLLLNYKSCYKVSVIWNWVRLRKLHLELKPYLQFGSGEIGRYGF